MEGLADGTIDMIATDHAPHSAEEKGRGLEKSAMGIVGLETAFPLLYTELVKPGVISMERLMELRATLDRNIQMLQVRAAKRGDLTVHRLTLPRQVCFCRRYLCEDIAEATLRLHDTYIAAARTGKMPLYARMFTMRMAQDCNTLDLLCCIPMEDSYSGEERMEFVETPAIGIYYRGPYEGIGNAMGTLVEYVKKNHISVTGPYRSIYLEGPPNRGKNSQDYVTQIAVPVEPF